MIEVENDVEDLGIDLATFDKEAEIAKFSDVKAVGWTLLMRLYTAPKIVRGLHLPTVVRDEDKYKNCVGLIIQKGQGVYKDSRYDDTGPWCEIGDWVVFPRHSGYRILVHGIPIWVVKEDAVDIVVKDPTCISKYVN